MKVVAIIVSYNPDNEVLADLIRRLLPQTGRVIVVDNGSQQDIRTGLTNSFPNAPSLEVVALGDNLGIATAQNRGIELARQLRAEYVILFDQDSVPAPDMVEKLLLVAEQKRAEGVALAAVGPRYVDDRQDNPPPFIQVRGLRVRRQPCNCPDSVVEVDYLIASGCLMPMSALDQVGGMQEEFFIDYVDIEWGLRARRHGLQSFGACAALMSHSLGDAPVSFMGRAIPMHSALRHYYHFRNAVWMYRQGWLPLHWKLADGWRLLLKYGFYSIFARPPLRHWREMTLGVWHGLTGRMGRR